MNQTLKTFLTIYLIISYPLTPYQLSAAKQPDILLMRERAEKIDELTQLRVKKLLPSLMKKSDIDMWLLISREYNARRRCCF